VCAPRIFTPCTLAMDRYRKIEKLGEGTYGVVYMAEDRETSNIVALKRIQIDSDEEGVPCTALREISLLKGLNHPNVVRLHDVLHGAKKLTLVFEYCDQDLKAFLDASAEPPRSDVVKSFVFQLLQGLAFCHDKRVLHRDLKPQNLLINKEGQLKLADFGLARAFGLPVKSYSHEVVTLWYRAPDVLLGSTRYTTSIDMWSTGCIFAEMLIKEPLFPGTEPAHQLGLIFGLVGTPSPATWPDAMSLPKAQELLTPLAINPGQGLTSRVGSLDPVGLTLLSSLLTCDPAARITAQDALAHPYFRAAPGASGGDGGGAVGSI